MKLTHVQGISTEQIGPTEVTQTIGLVQVIAPRRVIIVPVGIDKLLNLRSQEKFMGISQMDLVVS